MLEFEYIQLKHTKLIEQFNCSDEISVELFLREQALKLHQLRSAVTRLYFDENQNLVGYFTLHNDLIHVFQNQIRRHGWNLPNIHDYFPAIKLHYLGIDSKYRNLGYGKYLLAEAILAIEDLAMCSGCTFVTIEALHNAVGFYEKFGFVNRQRASEFQNMVLKLEEITC